MTVQALLLAANAVAFPLLLWRGGRADRLATLAVMAGAVTM